MGMIADLFVKLGLKKDGFDKGIDEAKQKSSSFGSAITKVGGIIAGVFAVGKIAAFTQEAVRLAAAGEGIRAAFSHLGGMEYLDDLKKATKNTVGELDLMKNAVKANNFQIPLKDLASLFEFATARAAQTGESVDYLVDSIVLGIGRKSPLILDNLGISAVRLRQELKGAGVEMTTVEQVAAAVGKIAQEEMKKMGDVAVTSAQKISQLGVQWSKIKEQFGKQIVNSESFKESLDDMSDILYVWGNKNISIWKAIGITIDKGLWGTRGTAFIKEQKDREAAIHAYDKLVAGAYETVKKTTTGEVKAYTSVSDQIKWLQNEIKTANKLLKETPAGHEWQAQKDKVDELSESLKKLQEEIKSAKREVSGVTGMQMSTGGFAFGIEKVKATNETKVENGLFIPEIKTPSLVSLKNWGKELQDAIKEISKDAKTEAELFGEELNQALIQGLSTAIESLAAGIGELFAGVATPKDFGRQVLQIIGKFMQTLGSMMITYGIAMALFVKSAKNPMSWGLALAAGVAMVAAGAAISGFASKGLSSSGSSAASGYSHTSAQSSAGNMLNGNVTFELHGNVLKGALANQDRRNSNFR